MPPLFRQAALDRLRSPEQFDQLLALAPPWPDGLHWRVWQRARRPKPVPTVLQLEAVECGAACLGMILAYHGRWVPLEELRLACGVSRDGTKASNLVKAARTYGLKAKGFSLELAQVRELPPPLVVFWNFNHFVVVEGFGADAVFLNDPATGPRPVALTEFDQAFTGVVLVFEPGPDWEPGGQRRSGWAALRPRLVEAAPLLSLAVGLSGLLVGPGLVAPWLVQRLIDEHLLRGTLPQAWPLVGGLALTAFALAVFTGLQQLALAWLEMRLTRSAALEFLSHVLRLPLEFFTQRYSGEVGGRLGLTALVANLLSERLATTLLNGGLVIFFGALMWAYSPLLALVSFGIAALNLWALRAVARQRVTLNQRLLQARGQLAATGLNGLQLIETLKATGGEQDFFTRWAGQFAKVENARQGLAVATELLAVVPPLLTALNIALMLTLGAAQVLAGTLTLGGLVAFQTLAASFLAPINQLVVLGGYLQEMEGHLERLEDVLRYPAAPASIAAPAAAEAEESLLGTVELHEVSFGYQRLAPPLIEKFNLTIPAGQRVALVGGSGSGKTTLARLVVGLYQPWAGAVLLDGQPRAQWPMSMLQRSLAYVSQDAHLFAGTVRDNLTFWDEAVPEAAVWQALRDAALEAEIQARGGLSAPVAEGGRNFSGGQRQRLELARALVRQPALLVLDEATSALDPVTEAQVMANLRARGCTCLFIAHRLSTVRDCDEIVVLQLGRIVQRGPHADLLAQGGLYAQLMQTEAE